MRVVRVYSARCKFRYQEKKEWRLGRGPCVDTEIVGAGVDEVDLDEIEKSASDGTDKISEYSSSKNNNIYLEIDFNFNSASLTFSDESWDAERSS